MDRDAQTSQPAQELLAAAVQVTPGWLRRITVEAATAGGFDASRFGSSLEAMVEGESARLLAQLADVLATDVDQQRVNPLAVFRA
ncbi:MAG TPA: hypothetical protein VLA10_07810, partial [Ilumatobacter sp.]|nr:hypothetical protein [Ilumatobacter sp.]